MNDLCDYTPDSVFEDLYEAIDRAHSLICSHSDAKEVKIVRFTISSVSNSVEVYRVDIFSRYLLNILRLPMKNYEDFEDLVGR
jgi:hypothetical protein